MNKRQIFIILAGIGFLALCVVLSGALTKEREAKPEEFEMLTAVLQESKTPETLTRTIPITGRLIPKKSVMLYAEVGGRASFGAKEFKEGVRFNSGEVLVRINSDELESSLIAKRSNFQSLFDYSRFKTRF